MSYNRVVLIGRMTAPPEPKATQSGVSVCSFRIAVDRRFSKDGEKRADFITVVAWRERAEFICKYFGKGDPIGIEGSIQTREYEDKNGAKRTAVEVVADNVFFVGGKAKDAAPAAPERTDFEEIEADSDLPF